LEQKKGKKGHKLSQKAPKLCTFQGQFLGVCRRQFWCGEALNQRIRQHAGLNERKIRNPKNNQPAKADNDMRIGEL